MDTTLTIITAILAIYTVALTAMGLYYSRKAASSSAEFYLGGRSIGPVVTAIATGATGRSAWLVLGMVGTAYIFGAAAIWAVAVYATTEMFGMGHAGKRLRIFTEKMNNVTWPDYLEARFGDKQNVLRVAAVLIIVFFYVAYSGALLMSGTRMFGYVYDMQPIHAVILCAGIILLYTVTGGYRAVVITTYVQGLIMLGSLVIMPLFLLFRFWGTGIISQLMAIEPMLISSPTGAASNTWVIGQLAIGLASWGQLHILTRYMSAKKVSAMRQSAFGNGVWNVICAAGACFTGLLARLVWHAPGDIPGGNPELITAVIATELMHPIMGGLIIAGIVSAIVSTVDQLLLTTSSTVTKDFYQAMVNKNASERTIVRMSRVVLVVTTILAVIMGLSENETIFWFVLFAFGGLGAAFGPVFILSVYWKKMTKWGALSGMIMGLVVSVGWFYTPPLRALIYELVPAFLLATAACILVSHLTRKDIPENVNELFDSLNTYTEK
ncbi:MAG: sodium/proline symporter [Oscillospiraceae bacterium]|nr:sodium/proline symporter [Oscillospiraceae bacterium]